MAMGLHRLYEFARLILHVLDELVFAELKRLGLPPSASGAQIRKRYRALASETHPTHFTDPEDKREARRRFVEVSAAFDHPRPDILVKLFGQR